MRHALHGARDAGSRDGGDVDWLRPAPSRAVGAACRINPAARRALGDRRSGRQGWTRAHRPHSRVGEEQSRRVDGRRGDHAWTGVPRDQQGRACAGRRDVTQGPYGMLSAPRRRAPGSTSSPRTTCGAPALVSATSRVANWIRSSFYSATSPSRHGALSRMQAEAPDCGERPVGNRARCRLTCRWLGGFFNPPLATFVE